MPVQLHGKSKYPPLTEKEKKRGYGREVSTYFECQDCGAGWFLE